MQKFQRVQRRAFRPGILRVEFDAAGHLRPLVAGEAWQPRRKQPVKDSP